MKSYVKNAKDSIRGHLDTYSTRTGLYLPLNATSRLGAFAGAALIAAEAQSPTPELLSATFMGGLAMVAAGYIGDHLTYDDTMEPLDSEISKN